MRSDPHPTRITSPDVYRPLIYNKQTRNTSPDFRTWKKVTCLSINNKKYLSRRMLSPSIDLLFIINKQEIPLQTYIDLWFIINKQEIPLQTSKHEKKLLACRLIQILEFVVDRNCIPFWWIIHNKKYLSRLQNMKKSYLPVD